MAENYNWPDHWPDADRRLKEGAQRHEDRLGEAERAQVHAHLVHTRGIGRVRSLVLAVFTVAVIVGVMVTVYVLVSGTATEEPPFLQCETPENCPAPLE